MKSLYLSILAFASGLLLASAWLGGPGLILLIAFIPLLYIDDFFLQNRHRYRSVVYWGYSLITFLIWNAASTWWIWYATPVGALFAIIVNSFLMSLVWWLAHAVSRKKGVQFGRMFLVFAWISFEYLHYHWELSWPWLTLGNGFANEVKIIQWYEYTGVFGGTLWVLMVNLLLWNLIRIAGKNEGARLTGRILVVLFVLFFPIVFSMVRYINYAEKTDPVNLVIAQPNIDPYHEKFSRMSKEEQLNRLLHVCDSLGTDSTMFFIGPETALHDVWEDMPEQNIQVMRIRRFLANKYPNAAFVTGAMSYRLYSQDDKIPETARYDADSSFIYDAFNSACYIEGNKPVQYYHKTMLVSGVEKIPYSRYLKILDKLVVDLGGTTGSLGTTQESTIFVHYNVKVAVPVCYESGYGAYMATFVRGGANLFFVITNDGWWKNSPGYKQHLSYSRLRAVEFRRDIARSGNTGISCIINQRGDMVKKTDWWKETSIAGIVNLNDKITFYARYGDYIGRVGVLIFALMFLSFLVEVIKSISM